MQAPSPKYRRWLIRVGITLGVLAILAVTVRILLRSDWVLDYVSRKLVTAVTDITGAEVRLGTLRGDLAGDLVATDFALVKADTLLQVDSLRIRYTLGSLWYRTIDLSLIRLSGVRVQVEQDTGGVWNYQAYLPPGDTSAVGTPSEPAEAEEGFLDRWRIRVRRLSLDEGRIVVTAPELFPEGPMVVRDLALEASYTQLGDQFDATLRDLSLQAEGTGLPDILDLRLQADADQESVSLAQLLVTVGQTRLTGNGTFSLADSSADARLQATPFAAATVNALAEGIHVYDDLDVDLRVNGSLKRPSATLVIARSGGGILLEASAAALEEADGYVLTDLSAQSNGLDLASLVSIPDAELPRIGATSIEFAGRVPVADPQKSSGSLSMDTQDVAYATYRLGRLHLDGTLDAARGALKGQAQTGANHANVDVAVRDPFGPTPSWDFRADARLQRLSQIDLSQELQLTLRADLRANGEGFDPYTARARYTARIQDVVVDSQAVALVYAQGRLNRLLSLDSALVVLGGGSELWLAGQTTLDFEEPEYELRAATDAFNLADVNGLEALETRIKARFALSGTCFSEDLRSMEAHLRIDSSWVNYALIDSMRANLKLDRSVLTISETSLNSDIADGRFDGVLTIDSLYSPSNTLEFLLQLKNLQPLAELAGADQLRAVGEIRGRIENGGESPRLIAIVGLDDVVYDSTEVRRVVGQYSMDIREQPPYLAELELLGPFVAGRRLQDIRLTSRGQFQPDGALGSYGVEVNVQQNAGLLLEGTFTKIADSLFFYSTAFDIRGPLRTYSQAQPFTVSILDGLVTSDTLRLEAPPDASLELRLHHVNEDSVSVGVAIHQVNAQALQESVMEEAVVKGTITGFASVAYSAARFEVDADLAVAGLGAGDVELDSVKVVAKIEDEQLNGSLLIRDQGYDVLQASLDVPFRLGDPKEFDEAFFELPVRGSVVMPPTDLTRYRELFEEMDMPPIEGTVSINSTLRGIAGIPIFDGTFTFAAGKVANIPVDRFEIGWLYDQQQRRVDVTTSLDAAGQRALTGEATVPLNLDLRNFEAILPQDADPVSGSLVADNFNLALLNPFIPVDLADGLKGSMAGRVDIAGTIGDPDIQGRFDLTGGSVMVAPTNVEFRDISMALRLQADRVELERLNMRGGSGTLQASGSVALDGFTPTGMDLRISGKDFRVMNTRDMQAALTLDATLGGTYLLPELRGSVSVSNANIFLDNFGDRAVEDVRLDSAETFESPSFYDSLTIRMRVQLEPNVWLRNRSSPEMALELEGDMDLLKEKGGEIQAFGSLGTRQGYATQYGKRFQVQRGDLTFSGDIANPQMDIVAVYELRAPEDIEISYLIGGTLEEPTFDFSSDPEMELENIISYTLFGKPFGALFSWQQSFSGGGGGNDLARDAAIGVLVDRVESLATEALGIDLLQIDTNRQGESTTTSVKAGKYITDKLFVSVLNELGGSDAITRVVLEYYVRRNLQFILTQGNDRRSGFDVRWKYEY